MNLQQLLDEVNMKRERPIPNGEILSAVYGTFGKVELPTEYTERMVEAVMKRIKMERDESQ